MSNSTRGFYISDNDYAKLNIAAASQGLAVSEIVRAFLSAGLSEMAAHDRNLAVAFQIMDRDKREAPAKREQVFA